MIIDTRLIASSSVSGIPSTTHWRVGEVYGTPTAWCGNSYIALEELVSYITAELEGYTDNNV